MAQSEPHPQADRPRASGAGIAALFAGALAIAFAPILTKLAINEGVSNVGAAFWRTGIAAVCFWAWIAARGCRETAPAAPRPTARGMLYLAIPGVIFAFDLTAWHYAFEWTSVANATLLANLASILVALAGWFWLKERFTWVFTAGGLAALAGLAMLMLFAKGVTPGVDPLAGDLLGILTAFFYAGYLLGIKKLSGRYSVVMLMAWTSLACAAVSMPIALAAGGSFAPRTAAGVWYLLALACISHCGGQGLVAFAFSRLPASFTAVSLLVQPLFVVILGWVILGEAMNPLQAVGAAVILAGIFLARMGTRPVAGSEGNTGGGTGEAI